MVSLAVLADEQVFADAGGSERIGWEPLGVVANVSAWNYPYFVAANVVPPALLTGNAVLYKPSEFASRTGLAMVERLHAAGVPVDVSERARSIPVARATTTPRTPARIRRFRCLRPRRTTSRS